MLFDFRIFTLAKDPEHPEQNQDAFAVDPRRGIATLADGVASGLFSRSWATILTESALADAPDPADKDAWRQWLAERRAAWSAGIDVDRLAWFQKAKLKDGTFSTLLAVRLLPVDGAAPDDPPGFNIRGYAVGDTCLFYVREGKALRTFPIETAAEFEANPVVIGSVDLNRDELVGFHRFEECGRPGDLLVLATDAVAAWAVRRAESGQPPAWENYWDMPEETWQAEVMSLREQRQMRYDDATLLLLRICDPRVEPADEPAWAVAADSDEALPAEPSAVGPSSPEANPAWPPGLTADPRPSAPAAPPGEEPLAPAATPGSDAETPKPVEEVAEKLKALSGEIIDGTAKQVARGLEKLKDVKKTASSVWEKYLKKFRP